MNMRRLLAIIFSLSTIFIVFGISPNPAYACSGGAAVTVAGLIADSDYVVKARVTEVDDVGQNVILHIENYLAGGPGPEFLLFNRSHPIRVNYILAGFSGAEIVSD